SLVKLAKEDKVNSSQILLAIVNRLKREQTQPVLEEINRALVNFDTNEAADLLLSTQDERGKLKENVLEALNRIGVNATSLTESLKKGSTDERLKAIQRLSVFRDAKSVEPLVSALSTDQELAVKVQAAESLGRLKDRRAVAPLLLARVAKE